MGGEVEEATVKIYKRRGWARRAAAKKEWHVVDDCGDGFIVRRMTAREEQSVRLMRQVEKVEMDVFRESVVGLFNTGSILYNRLRRSV
jgi:hypothetical protein